MPLVLRSPEDLDVPQLLAIYRESALETHPDHRRRGYGVRLLEDTVRFLEESHGAIVLLSGVGKRNIAFLQTHLRGGFVREKETWTESGETTERRCAMVYRSP